MPTEQKPVSSYPSDRWRADFYKQVRSWTGGCQEEGEEMEDVLEEGGGSVRADGLSTASYLLSYTWLTGF